MAFSSLCVTSIYLFFFLPHSTTAHPTSLIPSLITRDDRTCSFIGNPDIYGPGIRIGIYAQTLAIYVTKYLILSQAPILRDTLNVFSLALLIVSFLLATTPGSINAVEFFLILQILSWNCLTSVRARSSYAMGALLNRWIRTLGVEAMDVAALGLHIWFWFGGVNRMGGGVEGCTAKVFVL
jgi:hypothetical protein